MPELKTSFPKPIIKNNTQILTPCIWGILRENLNADYQIICDVLLNTGMRVEEFWDFVDHHNWYSSSRRCIDIPKGYIGKSKCTMQYRTILLSNEGIRAVEALQNHDIKYRDRSTMRRYLISKAIKAGISKEGITSKMFRKTLVSWLMATIPEKDIYIQNSLGHSRDVQDRHYLAMGFERRDVDDMRRFLRGWGE